MSDRLEGNGLAQPALNSQPSACFFTSEDSAWRKQSHLVVTKNFANNVEH